jgi:hypothetical protein
MTGAAVAPGDTLLSPQQLADYLGVPVATVYRWRHESTGPRAASGLASTSGSDGATSRPGWKTRTDPDQ